MKKLVFALWLLVPLFVSSQNQITLKSEKTFIASLSGVQGIFLTFQYDIPEINADHIEINEIIYIAGKISNNMKKAILEKNSQIKFLVGDFTETNKKDFSDPIYFNNSENYYQQKVVKNYSSGDYLYRAGKRYLIGLGVATGGAILTSVLVSTDNPDLALIGVGVSLTGIIISITGHIQLMEAGKALNREAITLSAAESGVGLAINF